MSPTVLCELRGYGGRTSLFAGYISLSNIIRGKKKRKDFSPNEICMGSHGDRRAGVNGELGLGVLFCFLLLPLFP